MTLDAAFQWQLLRISRSLSSAAPRSSLIPESRQLPAQRQYRRRVTAQGMSWAEQQEVYRARYLAKRKADRAEVLAARRRTA